MSMLFLELARTSGLVAASSGRLDKVGHLAALLERLEVGEVEPAVAFLSGTTRQGRLGIGYAAISSTFSAPPAGDAALTIADVDRALFEIATSSGPGAARDRVARL